MGIEAVLEFKVPRAWSTCYPSLKPLTPWMRDLVCRISALQKWINEALPQCFGLPDFTYPTGFLTAVLQTSARKNGIAIDSLSWEFHIINTPATSIAQYAKGGSYCHGLFLEGARWDLDNSCLTEPIPMELCCSMPVIHFKPVDNKKKSIKGIYSCPLYLYPLRTGSRERPSFVISCEVRCRAQSIGRVVALPCFFQPCTDIQPANFMLEWQAVRVKKIRWCKFFGASHRASVDPPRVRFRRRGV